MLPSITGGNAAAMHSTEPAAKSACRALVNLTVSWCIGNEEEATYLI